MEFIGEIKVRELEDLGLELKNKVRIYADKEHAAELNVWKNFDYIALRSSDMAAAGIAISSGLVDGKVFITEAATSDAISDAMYEKGFVMKTFQNDSNNFDTSVYGKGFIIMKIKGRSEIESTYLAAKSVISPIKVLCSVTIEAIAIQKDGGGFPIVLSNRFLKEGDILSSSGGNRSGYGTIQYRVMGKYGESESSAVYTIKPCNGNIDISDLKCNCDLYMVVPVSDENKSKQKE